MTSILGLPTELLYEVLDKLEQKSLKQFRCVSHECQARVTPILYSRVCFDFDLGGTNNLVNISRRQHLATHVKTIKLQRRSGLKKFDDYGTWRQATIYEYEPWFPRGGHDKVEFSGKIMSQADWHDMTDNSRRALFDEYQDDYDAITRQTSQLASAMSSAAQHGHGYVPDLQDFAEAHQMIRGFNVAIERLRNVKSFVHQPMYHYEGWGEHWRQIQFHRDALILNTDYEDDVDADALQLFVALQGTMLHSQSIRNVIIQTRGHAFWSATHLRRLLDWGGNPTTRWITQDHLKLGIDGWMNRIGGPVAVCRYMESATRYLARLESSCSRLESLEMHIDTEGVWSSDGDMAVSKAVSRLLQNGTSLKKLGLALRQSCWHLDRHTLLYHDTSSPKRQLPPNPQRDAESLLVSRNLFGGLVASQALCNLQTLDLTVVTVERHLCALLSPLHSLRHLALRYVSLLPAGGVWESIFQLISTSLRLESVEFIALEDVVDGCPRLILQSEGTVWNTSTAKYADYQRYESAIVDFVLRKSAFPPTICPAEFIRQQVR